MILIFGGAYQGKLDYARNLENFSEEDIFYCGETCSIDYSKKVIYGLERFVLACTRESTEAIDLLEENRDKLIDKTVIISDISQGIVPMDQEQRFWREMNGRTMIYLGKKADRVYRVFCGLGQRIK